MLTVKISRCRSNLGPWVVLCCVVALLGYVPSANAGLIPIGGASSYGVLYSGTGGHNFQFSNSTLNGNLGVGGTGVVQFTSGTIAGNLDFSGTSTAQYNKSGGAGPTSVNFNVAGVTTALSTLGSLNSSFAGLGNTLVINGAGTINESAGLLDTIGGVNYRIFNVTSYSTNDGNLLTINGDGSGNPVIFNFGFNSNVTLGGAIALTGGLVDDQVLWNFTSSGKNIGLHTNASSFPSLAYHGIILAPNDKLSMDNSNLDGRFFGGGSNDMLVNSGNTINSPVGEPATLVLLGLGGIAMVVVRRRRKPRRVIVGAPVLGRA